MKRFMDSYQHLSTMPGLLYLPYSIIQVFFFFNIGAFSMKLVHIYSQLKGFFEIMQLLWFGLL